jgi:hypothetical protein
VFASAYNQADNKHTHMSLLQFEDGYEDRDEMATWNDSYTEWRFNVGDMHPDKAWLLHDHDIWLRNPYYEGPPVPHPEDDPREYEADGERPLVQATPPTIEEPTPEDDIPF